MDETERETLVSIRDRLFSEMDKATGRDLISLSKEWRHVMAELRDHQGGAGNLIPEDERQDAVTEPERTAAVDEIKRKRDERRAARGSGRAKAD